MAGALRQSLGALLARSGRDSLYAKPSSVSKRFFASAHEHDDAEETFKWRNITVAAYIACIGMAFYTFSGEEHHEPAERQGYSYLHIRNKEFPWGPNGLFEYDHDH